MQKPVPARQRPAEAPLPDEPPASDWRETIESIAMAVILALLFRGFVAEAFVIPTGSMAPTLMGRHKDVVCPQCQFRYQVSASIEEIEGRPTGRYVSSVTCPVCRYTHALAPAEHPNEGSFSGDRILVSKFAYDVSTPQRWDVIVFKYPGNAVQNYIKRLVGLPGEKVWIVGGNIYTAPAEAPDEALRIARKPPHKLEALLQLVDDTDHIPPQLVALGWPPRWQTWPPGQTPAWKVEEGGRRLISPAGTAEDVWIRYRHLVPRYEDWEQIVQSGRLPADVSQRPGELITDFYAYNAWGHVDFAETVPTVRSLVPASYALPILRRGQGLGSPPSQPQNLAQHWVDDLALECTARVVEPRGTLTMMLVRGGVQHRCQIDLASGKVQLSLRDRGGKPLPFRGEDGQTRESSLGRTPLGRKGTYHLRLANCDHEMVLWVDGRVIALDGPATYDSDDLIAPWYSPEDPGDLAPAGFAVREGQVELSSVRIYRDKYYVAASDDVPPSERHSAYDTPNDNNDYTQRVSLPDRPYLSEPEALREVFSHPQLWEASGVFAPGNRRHIAFVLRDDEYFPLGDNSPQSADGRFWPDHHFVERDLLLGKALLIYWPHTWNRPVPFLPNVRRMGLIR
jgi:signal peptidase I